EQRSGKSEKEWRRTRQAPQAVRVRSERAPPVESGESARKEEARQRTKRPGRDRRPRLTEHGRVVVVPCNGKERLRAASRGPAASAPPVPHLTSNGRPGRRARR